ncbi:LytTR family DNA-binding domain-containing protein [Streptococcus plurextorum]|uniref:LytTR family DNA-binding domain-containing protein n=1 Tax=Streptococcus plurextorum TaxID=456876 RepID=UPI000408E660|nr:LytTR family DNA-binding domain-containing protein [Streptococcus plurextorum]
MKVKLTIDSNVVEDIVHIEAKEKTTKIESLLTFINNLGNKPDKLTLKREDDIYKVAVKDIYNFVIENRVVMVKTAHQTYKTSLRLYQIAQQLPEEFIQISQSEIVNLNALDHLELTTNGLVKIYLKNQEVTYSSRRYLKKIKEVLGL